MGERLTAVFLSLFCEKNSDGTKNLRLKGKDLYQRIGTRLQHYDMYNVNEFLIEHIDVIVKLDLCYNEIGDQGLEVICKFYLKNSNNTLEHLNLMSCDVTGVGLDHLLQVSSTLKLKTLRLNGNRFKTAAARVANLIEEVPTLAYVDVGDTNLTCEGAEMIFFKAQPSGLKILDVSRIIPENETYQYGPEKVASNFSYFLEWNKVLVEFHGQKIGFDGHDVEIMLEGLKRNQTLKFLDLGYNNIGDHGSELLADWLATRPILLGLNVAGNGIRDSGGVALSFGMPMSRLRLLDISYNHIGEQAMIGILNTIKKPFMLRHLYMWGNVIKHKACKVLMMTAGIAVETALIKRMLLSTVFEQEHIDIKVYCIDGVLYAARYLADHWKHRYYSVMDYGCPIFLKIFRNRIEEEGDEPRALVKFEHVDRFPPLDK